MIISENCKVTENICFFSVFEQKNLTEILEQVQGGTKENGVPSGKDQNCKNSRGEQTNHKTENFAAFNFDSLLNETMFSFDLKR